MQWIDGLELQNGCELRLLLTSPIEMEIIQDHIRGASLNEKDVSLYTYSDDHRVVFMRVNEFRDKLITDKELKNKVVNQVNSMIKRPKLEKLWCSIL